MKNTRDATGETEEDEAEKEDPLWQDRTAEKVESLDVGYVDGFAESGLGGIEYYPGGMQYLHGRGMARYMPSLRHVIPIRRAKPKKESMGVDEAGLWSFITYGWLSKYIYAAYRQKFKLEDIPKPSPFDTCEYNVQRLELLWQNELSARGPKSASLARVTWRFMRTRVILATLIFILNILLNLLSIAVFMRKLLEFAADDSASVWHGIGWALGLAISELLRSALYSLTWAINYRTAIRLRAACLALLYKKLLRLNSLGDRSVGEMINIFSLDGQRIFDLVLFGPMTVGGPVTIIFGVAFVYWLLGGWAVLGFCSFLVFYPIQYSLSRLSGIFRLRAMTITDERLNTMSEILHCIKLIKIYAWEDVFSSKIEKIRKRELNYIRKNAYTVSLASCLSSTVPYIAAIVTFLVHLAAGNPLTVAQGFPVILFYTTQLRLSITYSQFGLSNIIDLLVSCSRMKKVLLLTETSIYWSRPVNKSLAISIAEATFEKLSFGSNPKKDKKKDKKKGGSSEAEKKLLKIENQLKENEYIKILSDINFFTPKGKLIGICGSVGSGKSSLLSAVLGQMHMTKGKICRDGTCAYVSQRPWLVNATVKENILFGEKFNSDRYFRTVHSCCLNEDIAQLPGSDDTEIGERGVNLSGGQKQRIALARALYADRDIYLLDDPLSALDAQVRSEVFQRYIVTALADKTVLLVTHQIDCLSKCDGIAVMKDGTIVERGTHRELMSIDGEYSAMVQLLASSELSNSKEENGDTETNAEASFQGQCKKKEQPIPNGNSSLAVGQLIAPERLERGSVRLYTLLSYMSACGGTFIVIVVALLMLANVGSTAFSKWWLALWLKKGNGTAEFNTHSNSSSLIDFEENEEFSVFYIIYACSIAIILLTNLIRGYIFTKVTLKASVNFHNSLFSKIIKSTMEFFETTPVGRIQNLFAKDLEELEYKLPITLESTAQHFWQIVISLLFISVIFPWFILPMVFVAVLFYIISKVFRVGMRDLKRLENTTRSPIFSTVTTTVMGLETIHAFNKEKAFLQQFGAIFNINTACLFLSSVGARWLAIRIDTLAVFVILVTASLIIGLRGIVSPALGGLAITYAASLSGMFQYMVRLLCDTEVKLLSVERLNIYLADLQEEGEGKVTAAPSEVWPKSGAITFHNVCLQYRKHLPRVLEAVSFKVAAGEKIGIVGRTGSGKSSLIAGLLRLVEISNGKITIDRVDVSIVPLNYLRQAIAVVSQDPVLLNGSLRFNVDPRGKRTDEEIWSALEKVRLTEKIKSMENGLQSAVSQSGDNLSVGERQLLCLARAILGKTKILVLDEATSGVDRETEKAVLDVVKEEFSSSTVLTIAHRLETIMASDKVLFLSHGKVLEFDVPKKLLDNPQSMFHQLVASNEIVEVTK